MGPTTTRRRLPLCVWLLTAVGALVGVLLEEPGGIVENTIPSAATFAVVGLVIGLVAWAVRRRASSNR